MHSLYLTSLNIRRSIFFIVSCVYSNEFTSRVICFNNSDSAHARGFAPCSDTVSASAWETPTSATTDGETPTSSASDWDTPTSSASAWDTPTSSASAWDTPTSSASAWGLKGATPLLEIASTDIGGVPLMMEILEIERFLGIPLYPKSIYINLYIDFYL